LLLSEADFECKTALSGVAALRLLENDAQDAIVGDLNMPGMNGMELLAEVRAGPLMWRFSLPPAMTMCVQAF
jgi:CheY-like chemotaxis protein